jgi:FMN reductase
MNVTIVVGNPKARSRTYHAANLVAEKLTDRPADLVIDLADVGAALLDWTSGDVTGLVESVVSSDLVIFASPTFKGTYTGLLKLFLDRIATGALVGKTAVAFMVGATPRHSLACEVFLKPVLVELGASCPTPGLFLLESEYAGSAALDNWAQRARPLVAPWTMVP